MKKSPTEDQASRMVASYVDGSTLTEAAAREGFSPTCLRRICREWGVPVRPVGRAAGFSRAHEPKVACRRQGQAEMVRMRQESKDIGGIAATFGITRGAVLRTMQRAGIPSDYFHTVNHDYFETVDTEQKAYWLGFLSADGCVSDSGSVRLKLAARDESHVHLFREHIGSTHPVQRITSKGGFKPGSLSASLFVQSPKMVADLSRLGVVPRKSLTHQPWRGPEHLMRHYWRGMVDGDGWIVIPRGHTRLSVGLIGSDATVQAFAELAAAVAGTTAAPRKKGGVSTVSTGSGRAVSLLSHLYRDCAVALPRKLSRALQAIS